MAFPTTVILDAFNRADENPLSGGGNWDGPVRSTNSNDLRLVSNEIANINADFAASAWWTPAQFSAPLEVYIECTNITSNDVAVDYCIKSPGTATPDHYRFQTLGTILQLFRVDDGTFTAIGNGGSGWAVDAANGDSIGVYLQTTTLHNLYHKPAAGAWTLIGTSTDSTYTSGVGFIGCAMGADTTVRGDDFGGGAEVVGTTNTILRLGRGSAW